MYKVIFKGDMEPIYLSYSEGEKLSRDLESGTVSGMITLKGNLITVSSIKAVLPNQSDPDSSDRRSHGIDIIDRINREYRQWRSSELAKPTAERAKNLNLARMVWRAHTGSADISPIIQAWIIDLQWAYLENNPTLVYANPICYKSFVPRATRPNNFLNAGMRMVDRICGEDKHHANYRSDS